MILSKAPLRVSFFGGGSDIPAHFLKHGGATLSTAIDKYVYVSVIGTPQPHIKLTYSKLEVVTSVDDIQNEIVRNALNYFGIKSNIEITSFADIPTIGSGLGGSSAFTCALVAALSRYLEYDVDAYKIAQIACHIEMKFYLLFSWVVWNLVLDCTTINYCFSYRCHLMDCLRLCIIYDCILNIQ